MWKLCEDIVEVHSSLMPLLPQDERSKQTEWFQNHMHKIQGVMEKRVLANRETCTLIDDKEEHYGEINDASNDVTNAKYKVYNG